MEAWVVQNGMRYMFKVEFLYRYVSEGWYTTHYFAGTITEEQFLHDKEMLYGAIMASNKDNPAANKYINMYAPTANGLATWYCFMQDDGGLDNMIQKKCKIDMELACPYDSRYKGGVLTLLDDMESTWICLENLDSNEAISDDKKIWLIDGKLANTKYSTICMNAMKLPGGDTLISFLKHL